MPDADADADADEVFEALSVGFRPPFDSALQEIRRAGDEAVLMFRWPSQDRLFGVPVSLTRVERRLDWDQPARDLDEWLESVDLWLMEDVENGLTYRARRRPVEDYIELREPGWPDDRRFALQSNETVDPDWNMIDDPDLLAVDASTALAAQQQGRLLSWVFAYENNDTGSPVVGHATVTWDAEPGVARLVELAVGDEVPATVAVDLVRTATHDAAEAGATLVFADIDPDTWHPDLSTITGFRTTVESTSVATDFLTEDVDLAKTLFTAALADPGRWGNDRDRSGRYLPTSRLGRTMHRLRYGASGTPQRHYPHAFMGWGR